MKYFISAGEASGDIHASQLIKALKAEDPDASFTFLGGDLMESQAGVPPLIHYSDMAFMGFCEVIRHLPSILGNLRTARKQLLAGHPDALILVDYPSFNLKLAKTAYKTGIPVFYYISPKVWAWKEHRVKKIRRYIKRVLSILPFEVDWYRDRHDIEITYVGNPSVGEVDDKLKSLPPESDFFVKYRLDRSRPLLAIVPGSRQGEIRNNLPVMTEVARRHPQIQSVVAAAPGIEPEFYRQFTDLPLVSGATFELMARSRAALVTSGTATLEAALLSTPQVVCYRANGSHISYSIFKHILKIPFVSLPNLIAGRRVVAEQLVHLCTPDLIDSELTPLLDSGSIQRKQMLEGYAEIRRRLTDADAARSAAKAIIETIAGQ